MNKPEFADLMTETMAFYKESVSEFALNVWWEACRNFEFEVISKALTKHALDPDKGQYPPKPADLVRILQGTRSDRSLMAWGRVYAAMSEVGAYQDVDFQDPAIHAAITDMGGWPKLCRTELDNLSYAQHRFCESYRAYKNSGVEGNQVLIGDRGSNDLYAKRGLTPPEPILIGKATEIYKQRVLGVTK